jgi:hypothetical protein
MTKHNYRLQSDRPEVQEARAHSARICRALNNLAELVQTAWEQRHDKILGYKSWQAYCQGEFGQGEIAIKARQQVAAMLRGEHLSTRAIGERLGVTQSTVHRDLIDAKDSADPHVLQPTTVTGEDGRPHPADMGGMSSADRRDANNAAGRRRREAERLAEAEAQRLREFDAVAQRNRVAEIERMIAQNTVTAPPAIRLVPVPPHDELIDPIDKAPPITFRPEAVQPPQPRVTLLPDPDILEQHARFDRTVRVLRGQGLSQRDITEAMGTTFGRVQDSYQRLEGEDRGLATLHSGCPVADCPLKRGLG